MDILDIIIAKKKSFTGETETLTRQAQAAMAKANEVAGIIDDAQDALEAANTAQAAAESLNSYAQNIADELDGIKADISSAASAAASTAVENANADIAQIANNAAAIAAEGITDIETEDNNTSAVKSKNLKVRKKNIWSAFNILKNYTSKGNNEDGSMTQKAITSELNALNTRIDNLPANNGSGSGNISGNITSENAGSIVIVNDDGNIAASTIKENDLVLSQIISGSYTNSEIVGLEIDYVNKTCTRLQGAIGLNAGNDFNKFNAFGGRKRCIVKNDGSIIRFVTNEDTLETLNNKRIMVYQPAFYYMRVILSSVETANGIKINKEQIYVSDNKIAGFKLHPAFLDDIGDPVKYILLPAFESGTLRNTGTWELNDTQDINFNNDKLVSTVNTKPISGASQDFTYAAAEKMAKNNGSGWELTDMRFESLQQILMMIEYGTINVPSAFNIGITKINNSNNASLYTGSTVSLLNTSGRATSTDGNTEDGKCAISYRGVENPYGNIWRFIGNVKTQNYILKINNIDISFKLPQISNWINAFGYDSNFDWVYLPIETGNNANSTVPVGDFCFVADTGSITTSGIAGGMWNSEDYCGPFYYGFNMALDNYHYRSDSARITHTPVASSTIETNNYNLWLQG